MKKGKFAVLLSFIIIVGLTACKSTGTIRSDHTTDSPVSDTTLESEFSSDAGVREEIPTSNTEINEEPDAVYKDFTVSKEGMDELITLREFSGNGFVIYYDDKRFALEDNIETYRFNRIDNSPDSPEVCMEVDFIANKTADERLETDAADYLEYGVSASDVTLNGNKARLMQFSLGSDADSAVYDYYYIEGNGGCYSVKLSYFVEATEGWGTTLKSMANTFELLNS